VEGISTTSHELVYGVKPDLPVLFQMFSVGFFHHLRDGSHHRSGISDSKTMQGIALGHCRKSDGITMRGIVISVPLPLSSSQLPLNDATSPPYTLPLIDGSIHMVPPDFLASIISEQSTSTHKIKFPSWLGNSQKVMYLHDGLFKKGFME
jgi:hypothetical protein